MKTRTSLLALIFGPLVAFGLIIAHAGSSETQESDQQVKQKKTPFVEVAPATKQTVSVDLKLTGSVEPYRVARLASPAEGPVMNIRVREGDRAQAGGELLSIGRKKSIDAMIASLRQELKKEEDNLRRTRQLVKSNALPGEQLDQAKAAYEKVRAQLVQAKENAGDYTITAPWKGVISRLLVKEGEFVAPREALLEMYDPSSLVIRTAVPEKHAVKVTLGIPVNIRFDAYPDKIVKGVIERVYPYLDARLRTRTIEVVPSEPLHLLPGMFARLEVLLKTVADALVVPAEALVMTPKGQAVFVVEDGKAFRRLVDTGIEVGNRIQIISGIQPGDKVIVAGNQKLKDGRAVRVSGIEKPGKRKDQGLSQPGDKQRSKKGIGNPQ